MPSASDKALLTLARARFKLAEEAGEKQRERELADLRFYAGDQWDDDLLKSRQGQAIGSGSSQQIVPARPSLTINKTREPVRQVLNQERSSDLGIELIPADDWGDMAGPIDHTEIELREGLTRRIQRDSEAADARTWAFARSTIAGQGYWLVMTRYAPGKTSDQEIYVDRIYNQSTVLLDPAHEQPDGSDTEWGFYGTDMSWEAYKAEFPDRPGARNPVSTAQNDDEWRALGDEAPGWFQHEGETRAVRVMNYYFTEREPKKLYHLSNGQAVYEDELAALPPGVTQLMDKDGQPQTHTQIVKSIQWAKIDGYQVLDQTDWPGHYLPIIKVVGEELQPFDSQRRCEGIVRPMRDSCKGNNYIISKFVERVGLTPIAPIIMAGGQDEGWEDEWNAANTRTLSRLHYNQKDNFNQPVPSPPFRADARAEISDIATGVQIFGQAIASTSVTPETALGNADPTVKSGKLAKLLLDQAERGTSNFLDNLVRSIRHEARVINDLLYPIYGRPGRLARMMNGQGEMSAVLIGQPFTMQGQGKQQRPVAVPQGQAPPPEAKTYQLTPDADFNVAIKVSKNFETRRQEIASTLAELIGSDPSQMAIIGDKLWKYFDLPDHEEIEKRYKVMLAPPIQALLDGGQPPVPPEVQAQMQQLQAMNGQLQQLADKNVTDLKKAQIDQETKVREAHIDADRAVRVAGIQAEATVTSAEIKAMMADAQTRIQHMEALIGLSADAQTQARDHVHEMQMASLQHQQTLQQGDQQHGQALAQGQQQQANALEQGAQGHQQQLEQQASQPQQGPA